MDEFDLTGVKALVVEDDIGVLTLLKTMLEGKGAIVVTFESGKNVLEYIATSCPDIVILDVVIPYLDGFTILERLRKDGNNVPIILLTDKNSIDDKVKGLGHGADDYMTKPFSSRELVARIINVLRRSQRIYTRKEKDVISLGMLQIDQQARLIVQNNGESLPFTKTEFDLFCYLARSKGAAISHATLLSEVMGYRGDVETKALVMHIANIRRKMMNAAIEDVGIETVAGVGYKIMEY